MTSGKEQLYHELDRFFAPLSSRLARISDTYYQLAEDLIKLEFDNYIYQLAEELINGNITVPVASRPHAQE